MNGNADGARLVCNSAGDGLADPPGGIRGELEALRVVELLDRADQTEVAFLDKVQKQHATTHITLCDGDHQAQVRFDELLLCIQTYLLDTGKAPAFTTLERHTALFFRRIELCHSLDTCLDLHGEVDLFGRREQRDLADLFEIHAHRIAREHSNRIVGIVFARARRLGLG